MLVFTSLSSQCSTTGVTKAVVCAILSVGKSSACHGGKRFPLYLYLYDTLPYVRRHITVLKWLNASLNKHFLPSFLFIFVNDYKHYIVLGIHITIKSDSLLKDMYDYIILLSLDSIIK